MVFIAKIIPDYRKIILKKSNIKFYSTTKGILNQKYLSSENDKSNFLILLQLFYSNKKIIVGDYSFVSSFFIVFGFIFKKKIYIASDWTPVQPISKINKLRKCLLEILSSGFIMGSPLSKPIFKKTPIKGVMYMSSIYNYIDVKLSHKKYDFIYIGQFIDRKNIKYTIEIFNHLHDKGYKCCIVGRSGFENIQLNKLINKAKFKVFNSVSWNDSQKFLAKSRCLFYPSNEEVWGLTVLEALNNYCIPLSTNKIESFNYFSKKIKPLQKFKITLNFKDDLQLCEKSLKVENKFFKKIVKSFRIEESKIIESSIKSLSKI